VSTFMIIGLWHEVSLRGLVWAFYNAAWILLWQSAQRVRRRWRIPRVTHPYGRFCLDALGVLVTLNIFWFGLALARQPDLGAGLRLFRSVLLFWI
jgi:D-alanyl-lipoteichoic acid acyltransferase DltB (MBOAT superfamily)